MSIIQPGHYQVLPTIDEQNQPIFSVLVKRTYNIQAGTKAKRAPKDRPLLGYHEYYGNGDPQSDTIKFEKDEIPYKLATDIVFIGKAYTTGGQPACSCSVILKVGEHQKRLMITGNQFCHYRAGRDPLISDPMLFREMEIRYEKAYGGIDNQSDQNQVYRYPRNPFGTGFVIKNTKASVEGLQLPNIEYVKDQLTPERIIVGDIKNWNEQPLPQGLGWYDAAWYPRSSYLGIVPASVQMGTVMREALLGLVPTNQVELARAFKLPSLDFRFFNGASLRLVVPYLRGDEQVFLSHLTPECTLNFQLPDDKPVILMDIGFGEQSLSPVLQTLTLRGEDQELDIVWRGACPYNGIDWLPQMTKMQIHVE